MSRDFLSAKEAASRLGISTTTVYGWLGDSDHGLLVIRGQPVTIEYFQTGPNGQGRIQIEASEVDRLREFMRVRPKPGISRRPPTRHKVYPGITVPLGRPNT
jgi:hypothetical protein